MEETLINASLPTDSILRMTDDDHTTNDSFINKSFSLRSATLEERETVKQFVIFNHLAVSGYSDEATIEQIKDLPTDFPELYDDELWKRSKCFLLFDKFFLNKLIGCIGIRTHSQDVADIGYFYLDDTVRGKGLGKQLLQFTLSWTKAIPSRTFRKVTILTLRGIMENAYKLYCREGFTSYKEFKSDFYDVVCMELDLDAYNPGGNLESR
eukprot:gene890-1726_t